MSWWISQQRYPYCLGADRESFVLLPACCATTWPKSYDGNSAASVITNSNAIKMIDNLILLILALFLFPSSLSTIIVSYYWALKRFTRTDWSKVLPLKLFCYKLKRMPLGSIDMYHSNSAAIIQILNTTLSISICKGGLSIVTCVSAGLVEHVQSFPLLKKT